MANRLLLRSAQPSKNWPFFAFAAAIVASLLIASGCGSSSPDPASPDQEVEADEEEPAPSLQSSDILAREPLSNRVKVRHILIGWSDLAGAYGGNIDPRAKDRTAEEAEALTQDLYTRIKGGEAFESLMTEHSEDTGSALSGAPIDVTPDAGLVLDFKRLSLRLEVGEVGIVLSPYGWHIIQRVS